MASSSKRSRREHDVDIDAVPAPLRTRLGPEATFGLLELVDLSHREGREAVIAACTERFERRVIEQVSDLRVHIARVESSLRQDIVHVESTFRQDIAQLEVRLRQAMGEQIAGLRGEIATGRVELFKWCFLFWVGQVATLIAILQIFFRK